MKRDSTLATMTTLSSLQRASVVCPTQFAKTRRIDGRRQPRRHESTRRQHEYHKQQIENVLSGRSSFSLATFVRRWASNNVCLTICCTHLRGGRGSTKDSVGYIGNGISWNICVSNLLVVLVCISVRDEEVGLQRYESR